jgi:hypothetical protein
MGKSEDELYKVYWIVRQRGGVKNCYYEKEIEEIYNNYGRYCKDKNFIGVVNNMGLVMSRKEIKEDYMKYIIKDQKKELAIDII